MQAICTGTLGDDRSVLGVAGKMQGNDCSSMVASFSTKSSAAGGHYTLPMESLYEERRQQSLKPARTITRNIVGFLPTPMIEAANQFHELPKVVECRQLSLYGMKR